jgi:hypothetical protein
MISSASAWYTPRRVISFDAASAIKADNISGMIIAWFCVISETMTKAVIGACTTPVRNATMPTSASALAGTLENRRATSAPSPATIERDGEKIPPGMPLSADKTDAMNFSGMKSHEIVPPP